jgi:biotin carboxylase
MSNKLTFLVLASYEKGHDFMKQCRKEGCRVILLTSQSLENAEWPHESIDEIYYIPDKNKEWNMNDVIYAVSYLARTESIDRIVAMDDYDVEKGAALREHLRVGGMGDTTARYFRDKLAMRTRGKETGLLVPDFVHLLNYRQINDFIARNSFPFILKPRLHAGAIGVKKIYNEDELWETLNQLGDEQSFYLLEKFIPGDIYHVDSIIYEKEIKFQIASQYGSPPMEVAHKGRVFNTRTIKRGTLEEEDLFLKNKQVLSAMGLLRGVSHTEFIKEIESGRLYFLETSARVGGANISEYVKAATGINLWEEWAKIEILNGEKGYKLPSHKKQYAAMILSLAKQEWPDMSEYSDKDIVWKLRKRHHAGIIIKSHRYSTIEKKCKENIKKFYEDFFATQPMPNRPTD